MNDVRRALLFWPAFTSILIILIALISPRESGDLGTFAQRIGTEWSKFTQPNLAKAPEDLSIDDSKGSSVDLQLPSDTASIAFEPVETSRVPQFDNAETVGHRMDTGTLHRMEQRSRDLRSRDQISEVLARPHRNASQAVQDDAIEMYAATNQRRQPLPGSLEAATEPSEASITELANNVLQGDFLAAERLSGQPVATDTTATLDHLLQIPSRPKRATTTLPELNLQAPDPLDSQADVRWNMTAESFVEEVAPIAARPAARVAVEPILEPDDQPMLQAAMPAKTVVNPIEKIDLPAATAREVVQHDPAIDQVVQPGETVLPKSIANLAKVMPRSTAADEGSNQPIVADHPMVADSVDNPNSNTPAASRSLVSGNPSTWPLASRLDEQLRLLDQSVSGQHVDSTQGIHDWVSRVQMRLAIIRELPRLGDPAAGAAIADLDALALEGLGGAERSTDRELQIQWLQAAYAIHRRTTVWTPIWQIVSSTTPVDVNQFDADNGQRVVALVNELQTDIDATGDAGGWTDFLLLESIVESATGDQVNERMMTAQRVLSRVNWHGLVGTQREWLERESVTRLVTELQAWTRTPVDYAALLHQIERQESDAIDLAAIDIAGTAQTLRFSDNAGAQKVAAAIDSCYRNANIRAAISQEMLRRLIPDVAPTTVPVRTSMLGSRVKGISHINSDLDLKLRPSDQTWAFTLQTIGNVQTHSVGQRGRTAVSTRGISDFTAATPVEITADGIVVGDSQLDVRGNTRLRNVQSQYDSWPLLGSLARSIITSKYKERSGLTSRIANRRMTEQIGDGIDERLDAKVDKASERLNRVIMGPLNSLKLQPTVIDMKTTDQRLIARYRLAGDWQVGASTPRPRAPSDSLISFQVSQSAINNTLEQVVPLGQPTTLQSAFDRTMDVFGREEVALPADIPDDVQIQFAKTRPITVELEEGVVWITMRVVELSRKKGSGLTRFIVRAGYRPQINGLKVSLVRDGHLRISGPGMAMRQRLPIRAIFNKVFSPNHSIPLTSDQFADSESLAGTEISQLETRDGWFALAISPQRPGRIAVGLSDATQR